MSSAQLQKTELAVSIAACLTEFVNVHALMAFEVATSSAAKFEKILDHVHVTNLPFLNPCSP